MLELGEWYPDGETALLDSLDFLDFADGQVEQEGLHSGSVAFMRQDVSFVERCEDRDAVVGESSPRRRPDCARYPVSSHATREAGAWVFGERIHQVRVIFSSTASLGQGQPRVPSTACDAPPQQTEQKGMGVPKTMSF